MSRSPVHEKLCQADLRHTCATLLLDKDVHPKFAQYLPGHKTAKITLNLYSPWIPDLGSHAADAMNDIS